MNNEDLQSAFDRVQGRALRIGLVALALSGIGLYRDPTGFLRSYLVAYMFWLAIALGCFAIVMLHHMVGGHWGFMIRRTLEAGTRTVPLLAGLFVPLLLTLPRLYVWARPEMVASLALPPFKRVYLSMPFFVGRTVAYFAAWLILAYFLNRWSLQQDQTGSTEVTNRLQFLSGPGLLIYGFTITYASIDWVMSLEPDFFSTIFGMIFMILPALTAMALAVVVAMLLAKHRPLLDVIEPGHFNDYGNLLLTFVMLWAYLSFSQFLIIWAGNLQDEIPWFMLRATGRWAGVALLLVIFHFAVPFLLLLSRDVKRRMRVLAGVAVALIVMEWVDLYWIIAPAFHPKGPHLGWMDILLPIGLGGLWVSWFVWQLKGRPLLPLRDPRFAGAASLGS
jgi:hypothetical protein